MVTMAAKEKKMVEQETERRKGADRRAAGAKARIVIVDGHTLFRRGVQTSSSSKQISRSWAKRVPAGRHWPWSKR